jgi:glycosyltransferase involved in cell wall biosynthesis
LNHLFFISDDAKKYFIQKHQLSNQEQVKTSTSRIGINSNNKSYIAKQPNAVLRIISVAYIQKIKRVDLIVDALALMSDIRIEWYHAGHSNQSEKDFEYIKQYAFDKLALNLNISFSFLGKTGKDDLFQLYHEKYFDVFLNVSETEGVPVSMMEAMSYSVPVIGTNVGGVIEIIEDNKNGFLLSAYPEAKEVSSTIRKFQELNFEQKNSMRQNAFNTWNEKYNASKNYLKLRAKISEIIKEV